ncbi:MAG: hypothetical protein ACREQ9_09955, partial [Candidatus Binatia bacterium]
FYQNDPSRCGTGLTTAYSGQILHQPAWSLFAAVKLAGIEPAREGYDVSPRVPEEEFSLRLPRVGISREANRIRGYVRSEAPDRLRMRIRLPDGVDPSGASAWAEDASVPSEVEDGRVVFELPVSLDEAADWAVTW